MSTMVSEILLAGALLAGSPEVTVRVAETEAAPETVEALSSSTIDGLASTGVEVSLGDPWGACAEDDCTREAMAETSAAIVVVLSVEQQDNVFGFELDARSAATGKRLAVAEDVCEICGLEEVAELVELRAAALGPRLEVEEGTLRVISDPPGAGVYVEGREVGVTPLDVVLPPGTHRVTVKKPGFFEDEDSVEVVAGLENDLRFRLLAEPVSGDPQEQARQTRRWFIAGGVSLGVGVVGLAVGIPLVAMDTKPYEAECRADAQGNCAQLYDTMGAGASLTTAGVIGLAAGTTMMLIGRKRRRTGAVVETAATGVKVHF